MIASLSHTTPPHRTNHLANEAETAKAQVENKEGVNGNAYAVLDHTATAQNTHAGSQRPADEHNVDRYPRDPMQPQSRHEGSKDEGEESIANDADALRKGAAK